MKFFAVIGIITTVVLLFNFPAVVFYVDSLTVRFSEWRKSRGRKN